MATASPVSIPGPKVAACKCAETPRRAISSLGGANPPPLRLAAQLLEKGYAEPFLDLLGAKTVTSFDASDYEGASVVHDLNQLIPDEHKNRFSVVLRSILLPSFSRTSNLKRAPIQGRGG